MVRNFQRNSASNFDSPYTVRNANPPTKEEFNAKFSDLIKSHSESQEKLKKIAQDRSKDEKIMREFNDMELYSAVFEIDKGEFESLEKKRECFRCLLEQTFFNTNFFYVRGSHLNNKKHDEIKKDTRKRKIMLEIFITLINMYKFTVEISDGKMITKPGESQDLSIFTQIEKVDFQFPRVLELGQYTVGDRVISLNNCIGFETMLFLTSFFDEMSLKISPK